MSYNDTNVTEHIIAPTVKPYVVKYYIHKH